MASCTLVWVLVSMAKRCKDCTYIVSIRYGCCWSPVLNYQKSRKMSNLLNVSIPILTPMPMRDFRKSFFFTDCQLTSFKSTTTSFQVVVGCCVALGVQLFNLMMELANPQLTHTSVRWIMRLVPSFQTFPLSPPGRIIFASETFLF